MKQTIILICKILNCNTQFGDAKNIQTLYKSAEKIYLIKAPNYFIYAKIIYDVSPEFFKYKFF